MKLQHVSKGSPLNIPADVYNAVVDLVRRVKSGNIGRQAVINAAPVRPSSSAVLVQNNTGADLDRLSVGGISGVVFTPSDSLDEFQEQPVLTIATPATASHLGRFAVLHEPLKSGEIGWAWVDGAVVVQVYVSDAAHGWADVKDGDATELQSAAVGSARIIYKPSGTGPLWCVVRLCDPAAILDIRWNDTTHAIEVTYDGVNWVEKIVADAACTDVVS